MNQEKEDNYNQLLKEIENNKEQLDGYAIQIPFEELKKFPIDLSDRFIKKGYKCDLTDDSLLVMFE